MASIARSVSAFLAAAALAACSSAGVGPAPQAPALSNDAGHSARGSLVLRIRVARKKKTSRAAPRYISPATKAIKIAILGLTDISQTAALTPNAKGCSNGSCTVTIPGLKPCPSLANCYVATVATYDAVTGCPSACAIPQTAHELSADQSVAFTIVKARANEIHVTLDGIPTSVVLVPDADAALSGNMASGFSLEKCSPVQNVSIFGLDADNNYILGAGAPAPSLVSNDAADLPVTAAPSSPNRFTLTPSATAVANKVVQLTMGAAPLAGNGALPVAGHVNVTFVGICGVYVGDSGNGAVKELLAVDGAIPASPTINTLGSGFTLPVGVAVDRFGNVYVADNIGLVKEMVAVDGIIPASPTIKTLASGFSAPNGIAVDGSGNVYVAESGNNAVREILAVGGSIPAAPTINTLGSGFSFPESVAVDGGGNVYVSDQLHNAVKEMLAVGGSIPASPVTRTLGSGFNTPTGIALDRFGNVYVCDYGNNAVKEILAVSGTIPASPTINTLGSGFSSPGAVSVDWSGNVYVADYGNNAVKEIQAVGGSVPASPTINTLGSGFIRPAGIAAQ